MNTEYTICYPNGVKYIEVYSHDISKTRSVYDLYDNLIETLIYKNDVLITKVQYDRSNNSRIQYTWYPDGQIDHIGYTRNNKIHRSNGLPAQIFWYDNGNVHYIRYVFNGKTHNEYHPAYIEYLNTGHLSNVSYYIHGSLVKTII